MRSVVKQVGSTSTLQSVAADVTHIEAYVCQTTQAVLAMGDGLRPYVCELPLWSVAHRGNGMLLILLKLYYVSPDGVL